MTQRITRRDMLRRSTLAGVTLWLGAGSQGVASYAANEKLKREIGERLKAESEKEKLIVDLKKALKEVNKLSGLLPICSSCKKIRDDKGYWNQLEDFIQKHSGAEFSHGVCPDCAKNLYPEFEIYGE